MENHEENRGKNRKMSRRTALKYMGLGVVGAAGAYFGINGTSFKNKVSHLSKFLEGKDGKVVTRKDRTLGKDISMLGFGCMRLPLINAQDQSSIDEVQAMEMVDYAYQHGVNYFDTAWFYHQGQSEKFIGKALKRYPRDSFNMITKMPGRSIKSLDHAKEVFETQLSNCQVDYFDFYMLHSVSTKENYKQVYEDYGVLNYLIEEKKKGRIKRLGLSFHGETEEFPYFLDKYPWDFCMIQANYYDWNVFSEFLYNEASKRNIQCIIMEPVRGGMLANLTPEAAKVFTDADPNRSVASWAVQYMASLPNVLVVLSGMSNMSQVKDNVKTMTDFHTMTTAEHAIVARALEIFTKEKPIPCTECQYCMPCPFGVNIPACFHAYNESVNSSTVPNLRDKRDEIFNDKKKVFLANVDQVPLSAQPATCTRCKICEAKCPQSIPISTRMRELTQLIGELRK